MASIVKSIVDYQTRGIKKSKKEKKEKVAQNKQNKQYESMKLIDYIIKNDFSVVKFAKMNKLSYCAIYKYIKGHRPTIRNAHKIVKITNNEVTLEDLLGKEYGNKNQDNAC